MQKYNDIETIIRMSYSAFLAKDKKILEDLMAEDYTFTSSHDDHISKEEFFERCLPGSDLFVKQDIEKLFIQGNEAFILYYAELKDGSKFRDVEYMKIENGKIKEVQVYFGASTKK